MTTFRVKEQPGRLWPRLLRRSVAPLLVAGVVLRVSPPPHVVAAPPATATVNVASVQPTATASPATATTVKPTASHTSTPPPTPTPTATPRATASPSPSPSVSPIFSATPSGAASTIHPSPTPAPPTASPTPIPSAIPTRSATPTATATAPSTITPLLAPNIPATPPPPPGPTLNLAGVRILDNPGIGGNVLIARTALRHYGEYYRPDGVPWVGWCEMFADNVLAESGVSYTRYESAILDAISGPLYRGQAPAGSLVFFDQRSSPYGHVGIALGDGTMLSALGGGVVRTTYMDWVSYLGWRPYGTPAPNEAPINMQAYRVTSPDNPPVSLQAYAATTPSIAAIAMVGHAGQFANGTFAATPANDTTLRVAEHAGQFTNGALERRTP